MQIYLTLRRAFAAAIVVAILLTASIGTFAEEGEKYNDPDTPKIRASLTTVPDTNDIKELRAFITDSFDNWHSKTVGRFKDDEDRNSFHEAVIHTRIATADKILAILRENGKMEDIREELNITLENSTHMAIPEDSDTLFALKNLVTGHYSLDLFEGGFREFEVFVESLDNDPALKEFADFARIYLFNAGFYNASFDSDKDNAAAKFHNVFEQLQTYLSENEGLPILKDTIGMVRSIQMDCAESIESMPGGTIKKGSLMIPTLEFYRPLYVAGLTSDPDPQGWVNYIDREMAKYSIFAADDPMAAFREAVDAKKIELEKHIDEKSRTQLFPLEGTANEMEQRAEALKYFYTTLRPVFAASDEDFAKEAIIMYDMNLKQLEMVGLEFELEAVLVDGTKIDIKDFRGKVVLIDYWATWCGPCIGEMPTLKGIYKNYHEKGFEIIGLSVDEDLDALRAFIEKEELPWQNASQVMSLEKGLPDSCKKYNIIAYPMSILIDRDGKVVRADARGMVLFTELGKLFPPR